MPRVKNYYIPDYVWHITHRCYEKEFLLRYARDRRRWTEGLFEARKRYGLQILNYIVTSNHIHLLVSDSGEHHSIQKSVQMVASETAREYNLRKNRDEPFWEDRFHVTAVQSDQHLIKCMLYIDFNMVRAGIVSHPSQWEFSGFNEIRNPKKRYGLIDHDQLMVSLKMDSINDLASTYSQWVEDALENENHERDAKWSQSIAVGDKVFVENMEKELGPKARYRKAMGVDTAFQIQEDQKTYITDFNLESSGLMGDNAYYWNPH